MTHDIETAPASDAPRKQRGRRRRALRITGGIAGGLVLLGVVAVAGIVIKVVTYTDPYVQKVADAGYEQKTADVNEVAFSYVEGPDNGEPLVLLHAQLMNWFDYSRVMPDLAENYHVYVVDYQGHGETTYPDDYEMSANNIGADLGAFLDEVVGEPAYVSGNSSGGLLTLWLAANRGDMVKAIVLEDPPLFASEYPRIKETVAIKAFSSSEAAVQEGETDDFLNFWLDANKGFFNKYVAPGSADAIKGLVAAYRAANPGEPTEIGIIPDDTVKLLFQGLEEYDPRFGAAFYEGTWNEGFDHAEALAAVECPVLLMHANWSYNEEGLLDGAMDQDDADLAMSYLQDGTYVKVDSDHVVHLEHPDEFVEILDGFLLGEQ
ncbi:alpha/beta fold hydrolase [Demequina sp. NBRC 110054]|uniref:alpha/beta fold hydrolase n=1 Tax=Demequina sp. NBRC 110054 TaxID=1570343 RepID=UPI00190EE96B|nr:alpha/beta hydrolase [Demequina sp. NBRC 110054]